MDLYPFRVIAGIVLLAAATLCAQSNSFPYGGGPAQIRYSPLTQINRDNVRQLEVAWTFDTKDGRSDPQTQPVVIDGILYGVTPRHAAVALNGATGELLWKFDPGINGRGPNRGVAYWKSADGADRRIFSAVNSFVFAIDAVTGKSIPTFGKDGRIDLREGLGRDAEQLSVILTSPGIVYKDLLIVGGRMPEALPAGPGAIRAFDVRTGELKWAFNTIPRPGEFGYDTWPKDAWTYTGASNNWCGMSLDEARGIVFVPTGSPASDFYGADRIGDNLFSNTLLALDASTGKRIWHFQAVKHDLWDRDFPTPPCLVTIERDGKKIDAVVQPSKQGWLFVFDRVTGEPLFPIEYRNYPASTVPGEIAATTQPLPTRPAPYARQILTENMLTNRTPAAHANVLERFKMMRSEGQFVPIGVGYDTIIFPGFDGGAEWGGSAFDPQTGLIYVNSNEMAWVMSLTQKEGGSSGRSLYMQSCAPCHKDDMSGTPGQMPPLTGIATRKSRADVEKIVKQGGGRMPGFPSMKDAELDAVVSFVMTGENKELAPPADAEPSKQPEYRFTGYTKFLDADGYPAIAPPWGTLNAINVNTGEYAWSIPFGEYPELAAAGMTNTGSENYGGPVVTAGGIVFIAATNFDRKFRAFDKLTGELLWETTLPMSGNATPAVYEVNGRQFVVVYATGGKDKPTNPRGGIFIAFALPAP